MASYNKVIFMGNLTRDPETKSVGNTQKTRITIASTKRGYTKKDGGVVPDSVCYMDVDFWGPLAKMAAQYLKKASNVQVDGYIEQSDWIDAAGNARTKHIIHADGITMVGRSDTNAKIADVDAAFGVEKVEVAPKARVAGQKNPIDDNELPF